MALSLGCTVWHFGLLAMQKARGDGALACQAGWQAPRPVSTPAVPGRAAPAALMLQPPCCTAAAAASCSLCWCSLLCDLAKVGSSTLLRLHLDKAKQPVSETASTSPQISAHWY